MTKAVEALKKDLSGIRTGRASPALIERLPIEYYGATTPLNQLAGISAPEPRLLVVQPWDRSAMGAIEKGILKSELGLNPTNDGKVIRLAIPTLTEERRRELVKFVKGKVEEGKVAIRNLRREAVADLKDLKQEKMISEDDERRADEKAQELTDRFIKQMDAVGAAKEAEILEV
ncbi:MAG: ribosome recycling factor [Chloroflexi bacterium]|nr:ribosome recycling factor [Chloroflexota bacterium]